MPTTTNYGWTTPADTDLVKDGASAIRTLGTSIDTTTKNLNPSTTLGDIEYRSSTANTNTRLAIGSTGQVLTVAGGVPSWATPTGALAKLTTLSPSAASEAIADSVFTADYDNYMIVGYLNLTANANLQMQLRSGGSNLTTSTYITGWAGPTTNYTAWFLSDNIATDKNFAFTVTLTRPYLATVKQGVFQCSRQTAAPYSSDFYESTATSRDGIRIFPTSGTFTGQIVIYGLAD